MSMALIMHLIIVIVTIALGIFLGMIAGAYITDLINLFLEKVIDPITAKRKAAKAEKERKYKEELAWNISQHWK